MKKVFTAVLALSLSFAAMAQTNVEKPKHNRGERKEHFKKGDDFTSKLNLTDDQKSKLKTLNENFRTQMKDLNINDDITVKEQREKRMQLAKQHQEAVSNLLTPEQRKQAAELKKDFGEKGKTRGKERFAEMEQDLNLTAEQSARMKAINENHRRQMQELKTNTSLTEEQKKEKMKTLAAEQRANIQSILTDEQKAKMKGRMKNHSNKGGAVR